jgi:hypothetical protein
VVDGRWLFVEIQIPQQTTGNLAPVEALRVSQQKCEKLFHVHKPWRAFYMPETVKYPLKCGCAGPKYISMCFLHQELTREAHNEALTGNKLSAENEGLKRELAART